MQYITVCTIYVQVKKSFNGMNGDVGIGCTMRKIVETR